MIPVLTLALVIAAAPAAPASPVPPCLRLARAGTQVQGSVTVCPGRYRIADPTEMGVLIVASSGTRIDLTGGTPTRTWAAGTRPFRPSRTKPSPWRRARSPTWARS